MLFRSAFVFRQHDMIEHLEIDEPVDEVVVKLSPGATSAAAGAKTEAQLLAERPDVKKQLDSIAATLKEIRAAREAKAAAQAAAPKAAGATPVVALGELSGDTVTRGLKEALGKGLERSLAQLGRDGGFLTNLAVRIPMPEQLAAADKLLRKLGQERLADEFVASMNHAAEQAVPAAAETFAGALQQMSIQDAQQILQGPDDAATQFFRRATSAQLREKFRPIVEQATAKAGVTAAYKQVADKAALASAFVKQDALDVDGYVTGKALDGLFKTVADEEKRIRQNPVARTTDLLKSVFGALKK